MPSWKFKREIFQHQSHVFAKKHHFQAPTVRCRDHQNFKLKYHKKLLKFVILRINDNVKATDIIQEVNILKAISWIKSAWGEVSDETIFNCFNSFPTIIKIEKSYIQTTIFFIYFQKQTIGCMKLNSIYFMFISIGQKWCNCVQELIIMQNYTSQLIGFP